MNPHWHDLIQRHIDGLTSEEESSELQDLLTQDDNAASLYLRYMNLDLALEGKTQSSEAMCELLSAPTATRAPRWFSWRPLTAAAAGLVIGLFSASLAFGYIVPRAVATASRLFALVDGGFEKQHGRVASGFPLQFGVWSGDAAEIAETPSVATCDGRQALRFVRAEREPALPNYGAASCDVYQLVDLRPLKAEATTGEASLELSIQFLDSRESSGEPVTFIGRLHVFAGSPDALPDEWPLTQKEALAAGSASFHSDGGSPQSWHQVTTKVLLPPQADFAVVHLLAHNSKTPTGTEAVFGRQFVDDVRLTLKTQPVLPVRLAQR